MGVPVTGRDLVADQGVAGGGVGDAEQGFGQAHQGNALLAGQGVFPHQPLDRAAGAFRAQRRHQTGGQGLGLRYGAGRQGGAGQQGGDARRLRPAVGGGDGGAQRRLRLHAGNEGLERMRDGRRAVVGHDWKCGHTGGGREWSLAASFIDLSTKASSSRGALAPWRSRGGKGCASGSWIAAPQGRLAMTGFSWASLRDAGYP